MLKKVFRNGNSKVITVPQSFDVGQYVDVIITPVEIRKVNKESPVNDQEMHRYSNPWVNPSGSQDCDYSSFFVYDLQNLRAAQALA